MKRVQSLCNQSIALKALHQIRIHIIEKSLFFLAQLIKTCCTIIRSQNTEPHSAISYVRSYYELCKKRSKQRVLQCATYTDMACYQMTHHSCLKSE